MSGHYLDKLSALVLALPSLNWQETLIGASTLAVLLIWPRFRSKVPGHLVALLLGSLAAWLLSRIVSDFSVATIGSRFHFEINGITGNGIPPILPSFEWPWNLPGADGNPIGLNFKLVRLLFPSAITIAILGALESLLCAVVADGMSGKKHNPNDELIGQGIGNLLVPLSGDSGDGCNRPNSCEHQSGRNYALFFGYPRVIYPDRDFAACSSLVLYSHVFNGCVAVDSCLEYERGPAFYSHGQDRTREDVFVLIICFLLTVLLI